MQSVIYSLIEPTKQCGICYENSADQAHGGTCGEVNPICTNCIKIHLLKSKTCPFCRAPVDLPKSPLSEEKKLNERRIDIHAPPSSLLGENRLHPHDHQRGLETTAIRERQSNRCLSETIYFLCLTGGGAVFTLIVACLHGWPPGKAVKIFLPIGAAFGAVTSCGTIIADRIYPID